MHFLTFSRKTDLKFFPAGPTFLALWMNVYQSALNPRKVPCPDKFLVNSGKFLRTPFLNTTGDCFFIEHIKENLEHTILQFAWRYSSKVKGCVLYCLLSIQGYIQGAGRKRQLISYFVEHFNGNSWKILTCHFPVSYY